MGTITENYSNLNDLLVLDYRRRAEKTVGGPKTPRDILLSRVLRPTLPANLRLGPGTVIDVKDRPVGPFDMVGCWESYPAFGEGNATTFLIDGVVFCLAVRPSWTFESLSKLGEAALNFKSLSRKASQTILCLAVGFEVLAYQVVSDFLKTPVGNSVDGICSIGQHVMIRNNQGWYGDTDAVPFVSERGGGDSLKAFSFFLLQACQAAQGVPFSLVDYQHL